MTARASRPTVARVGDLRPGDEITELTTPRGPWMLVQAVEPATRTIVVEADDGFQAVIGVESWATDAVLRRVPAAEAALRAGARPLTPRNP